MKQSKAKAKQKGSSKAKVQAKAELPSALSIKPARTCILVLGMHRSGTSALTRMLNLLGCSLSRDLLGAGPGNSSGHWESSRALEINESLLQALGRSWDDARDLPLDWVRSEAATLAREQIRQFIDDEFLDEQLWALKDPRLCRLAPIWMEVIAEAGFQLRFVIPVRHPAEVAFSLARRDRMGFAQGLQLWHRHLVEAEQASRRHPRVLVHYQALLADWRGVASHISSALGLEWPQGMENAGRIDEFVQPNFRNADATLASDGSSALPLPAVVAELYPELLQDESAAWQAIADSSLSLAAGATSLARSEAAFERHGLAIAGLLGNTIELLEDVGLSGLADAVAWQRNAEWIERVRQDNPQVIGHAETTGRYVHELVRQVEAQRKEFGPRLAQLSETVSALTSRVDPLQDQVKQVVNLHQALGDRDAQLLKLHHMVAERTARITDLSRITDNLEGEVARLNHELVLRDERVSSLHGSLADHDALVAKLAREVEVRGEALRAATVASSETIALMHGEIEVRGEAIAAFTKGQIERDALIASLAAETEVRGEALRSANAESAEKIARMHDEIDVRGEAISALEQGRLESDARIVELIEQDERRAAEIASLKRTIAAREERLARLVSALQDSDAKVVALSADCHEYQLEVAGLVGEVQIRDQRLDEGIRAVAAGEARIQDLLASRSWRMTRPLRAMTSFLLGRPAGPEQQKSFAFDPVWYLKAYPDVAQSGMDAREHYLSDGKREGRHPVPQPTALPSALSGKAGNRGIHPTLEFDEQFYLRLYPDIAKSGTDPFLHYFNHGKAEGRLGTRPQLEIETGGAWFDPSKETVLVVSHEASRTGAPILSLNIVQGLKQKYNVIALLLGPGPMVPAFRQEVSFLVGPVRLRDQPLRAPFVIEQLVEKYPLKFAIVNSIESRVVLESLAREGVPSLSLIHEFAAYTRPRHAFREAILWAGETIFSTPITRANAVSDFPELVDQKFSIIAQGRCTLHAEELNEFAKEREDLRVLTALRPEGPRDDQVVVLGAGYVQHRKGVDLFIDCAARVLGTVEGEKCRFVWIGKGFDPEHDMAYSVYLADQLRQAGLEGQVTFMDETSSIEAAYAAADILLVSSRLDPLPNVAIDAMAQGLPVICFDKTTGIADFLTDAGLAGACVSPYLDTADMAAKVLRFAASKSYREEVGQREKQMVADHFDMGRYIGRLESVASAAAERITIEKACVDEIIQSGLMRPDYFQLPQHSHLTEHDVVRFGYVRSWATGIGRRKLFPGFHPGIYLEQHGTATPRIDPLVDYLRSGKPEGPWRYDVIDANAEPRPLPSGTRVALHLHVFYADLLVEMLDRLSLNSVRPDLLISVPSAGVAEEVGEILKAYPGRIADVQVVPNRGRDIGPFLTAFGSTLLEKYDIVGHLHTKKTADLQDASVGRNWYLFLLENLLGGKGRMADVILGAMAADPSIGMAYPDDPNIVGWGGNRPHAEVLGRKLGIDHLPEYLMFPVGTMFWARVEAIRPLLDLRLGWDDYPHEPLPYDGSMLHALERLFPMVGSRDGFRSVLTNVTGVTR